MNTHKIYLFILAVLLSFSITQCSGNRPSGRNEGALGSGSREIKKVATGKIVTDGRIEDWSDIGILTQDVGSKERGEHPPQIDLKLIKVTHDGDNLYFLLEAQPVAGGISSIYVDSDGNRATGLNSLIIGNKTGEFHAGLDYTIKVTYSSCMGIAGEVRPMLIYQVEKLKKAEYGYKSELVGRHRDSNNDPSCAGIRGKFQEIKIPFRLLDMKPSTDIAFLFVEGSGGMFTEYDKHCQLIKVNIR